MRRRRARPGPTGRERPALAVQTAGPVLIVTALCTTRPDPASNEFEVVSLHPGVAAEQVPKNTGWAVQFAVRLDETPPPTEDEIDACGSYSSARRGRMDPLDHPGLLAGSLLEAD